MASISTDANGNRTVQFVGTDRKRRSVRCGPVPLKVAETLRHRIEHLNALACLRQPMDADTAKWAAEIGDELAAKLAAVGLIPPRAGTLTLAGLTDRYLAEKEKDNKAGTKTNHRTITNDLTGHFGADLDIRNVTPAEADKFLAALKTRELAPATIARRLRRVRSIFAFAVKRGFLPSNPFAELRTPSTIPAERKAYVTAADARKLIEAANPCWRLIVALARFGGLRCPSEVLTLRWKDVDFAAKRITVRSPKTERIPGKEVRIMPMFGTLAPYIEEARDNGLPGETYVVGGAQGDGYRASSQGPNGWVNSNLRTTFAKLIDRAGLTPWPRLFHTLRASCETDLLERFPISAVTEWLGHSAAVALKHYARVPDELFQRAADGGAESGAVVVQNAVQSVPASNRHEMTKPTENLENKASRRLVSHPDGHCQDDQVTLRGFEPRSQP